TGENRTLFWQAIKAGAQNLLEQGKQYSPLNPDRILELISLHKTKSISFLAEENSDSTLIINGEEVEKIGPGWG
ncbi:MAG: hypothetical protein AAFV07_14570, partial [Bacteroidota bacterium]